MPRKTSDVYETWKINGRSVGYVRTGRYHIARSMAGRRVRIATGCITREAADAEYARFELNPGGYVARSGRRAFTGRVPRQLTAVSDPFRAAKLREQHLERTYKITTEEYDGLRREQGDRCAICGSGAGDIDGAVLEVDHDHATGVIRGLLCGPCNRGIGMLGDSTERLRHGIMYLERALASRDGGPGRGLCRWSAASQGPQDTDGPPVQAGSPTPGAILAH